MREQLSISTQLFSMFGMCVCVCLKRFSHYSGNKNCKLTRRQNQKFTIQFPIMFHILDAFQEFTALFCLSSSLTTSLHLDFRGEHDTASCRETLCTFQHYLRKWANYGLVLSCYEERKVWNLMQSRKSSSETVSISFVWKWNSNE